MEIRIHGRGGQGSVTAAELLAVSAFYDQKYSQAFPNFGVERRGAPVMAFARISNSPINLREQIYNPEYIIVQDSTLVNPETGVLQGVEKAHGILINTEKKQWPEIKNKNIFAVPATQIAIKEIGKPFINTAVLGAFAAMSEAISLNSLKRAITEKFHESPAETVKANVMAMEKAYHYIKENYQL